MGDGDSGLHWDWPGVSSAGAAQTVSAIAEISTVAGEGAGVERWRGQASIASFHAPKICLQRV